MSSTSPAERSGPLPVEDSFAQDYDRAFVEFVRHVSGQGVPVNERVLEGADEKATRMAVQGAYARGYRSTNFTPMAKAGLVRMLARYGY